ncbi:uncharacterized protein LOC108904994 [Anoplophora glabripennis]|uniref:uncharacterized protein LOC108904994 n=1 Tax=Anoplophora glabripennis TaxID=217634 RepID=UPI000C762D58|nr:uncharacterized protein LOC108904994 [Anoplophora glabripennis]
MTAKLYYSQVSPSSRAVLMCAKAIGLDLVIIQLNIFNGEQHNPEFKKLNPLHTIPTLDDNGFVLYDSHAIMAYLVGKYAKDKSLYPEDLQKRAIIDQRLHFDSGILFARHLRAGVSILRGAKTVAEEHVEAYKEAYGFVETFLQDNKYIAGDSLSIADLSILNTITNANILVPVDEGTYPKITAWIKLLKTLPYYEITQAGADVVKSFIKNKLEPVSQSTISRIEAKWRETGTVKDLGKPGRPGVPNDKKLDILVSLNENPNLSSTQLALDNTVHRSTVTKFLKKEKWHPYKIQLLQELLEDDPDRRNEFCQTMTERTDNNPRLVKQICFSDEATFCLNGEVNRQNFRYWAPANPHWFTESHSQYNEKVNVWAGIINNRVIGPYFFEGSLTGERYHDFLVNDLIPALATLYPDENMPDMPNQALWFQQDGAPPHYAAIRSLMAPKLYYDPVSPSSRATLMCAKAIGLDMDLVQVSVYKGEQHNPEFIKLNPLHSVPTLDDNGFVLYDSHAIMAYLVGKYAKDKSLYPEDLRRRAIIDQRLHFDSGVLFARHACAVLSILKGQKPVGEEHVKAVNEAYGFIEIFLQHNKYVAGDSLSIADFSILTTISNANVLIPFNESTYPKLTAWRNLLKILPYYEINQIGLEAFISVMRSKLS